MRDKPTIGAGDHLATYSIPWAKPDFLGREREYVADAVASSWISAGPYLERFERELAAFHEMPEALAVANGTVALHLAYLAIGLEPGDEVLVPGFAFQAAANVALQMRVKPIFAEVDPHSWCLTAEAIERALTPQTKAVVPVHTYGNACDMDSIIELCRVKRLNVIEDAAESFGTRYKGRLTGTIGDIGSFSFQATKTITTGEGGMVLTTRRELVEPMKLYRSHGMLRTRYLHEVAGLNFRLTNMQAALGCAQLERLPSMAAARRDMDRRYRERLINRPGILLQHYSADVDPVVWAIAVELDPAVYPQGRDAVMAQLGERGIECRPGFYPPSAMPKLYGAQPALPICDKISANLISLPSFPSLTEDEIEQVCDVLIAVGRA